MDVSMTSRCPGLYCGRLLVNGSVEGECGVCPRGERANHEKVCERCDESPELYDWLYLGFMAMLPLVLHWFFIERYSGKKSSSALLQHVTASLECSVSALVTLLLTEPVGLLSIRSCRVQMLSDWYTMLYNPSPDYVHTLHCTQEAVYPLYTIVLIYYAFCLVMMMLLRPLLVKKIACGLGKSDRFRSIYAALYFFPILAVLQAVGGGLLCESPRLICVFPRDCSSWSSGVFQITPFHTSSWCCRWSRWLSTCRSLKSSPLKLWWPRRSVWWFCSATGCCTPTPSSPSPCWTSWRWPCHCWLWFQVPPSSTSPRPSSPSRAGSCPRAAVGPERHSRPNLRPLTSALSCCGS